MDLKRLADAQLGQEKKFKLDVLQFSSSTDIDRLGDVHFLGLPREITLTIFSYFDHKDLCRLAAVCKSWYRRSNDPLLWKQLSISKWPLADSRMYSSWKELFKDSNSKTPKGTFQWRIPNFTKSIEDPIYSDKFVIGKYEWTLLMLSPSSGGISNRSLSLYLSVRGTLPKGFREAGFSVTLKNAKWPSKSIIRSSSYGKFYAEDNRSENEDWGFPKFCDLKTILDPREGYLLDDTLSLDVVVTNLSDIEYWLFLTTCYETADILEGMDCLFQLSYTNINKQNIVKLGGLPLIIGLLQSGHHSIISKVTDTLWNLSSLDENKSLIVKLKGLAPLFQILISKEAPLEIKRNIMNVLWNVSTLEENKAWMDSEDYIRAIVYVLGTSDLTCLHLYAICVLWNLSTTTTTTTTTTTRDINNSSGGGGGHWLEERKRRIVACGALPPLIAALKAPTEDISIKAAGVLYNLAINDSIKSSIMEYGGVQVLLNLFLSHRSLDSIKIITDLLWNMSWKDDIKKQIAEEGGIPIITRALQIPDKEVQRNCGGILCNLAIIDGYRVEIAKQGAIPILILLLSSSCDQVQTNAVYVLRNLSSNEIMGTKIIEAGGLPSLIRLLQTSSNHEVLLKSSGVLYNLAISDEHKAKIVEAGALKVLIDVMATTGVEELQQKLAGILWNLSWNDENEEKIVALGGIKALCRGVKAEHEKVIMNSVGTLCNLSLHHDQTKLWIYSYGVCEDLIPLLYRSKNEALQRNILNLLWNLSTLPINAEKMGKMMSIESLVALLSSPNFEILRNTMYLLVNLAMSSEDYQLKIEKGGIIEPLLAMLQSNNNEQLQVDCASILVKLFSFNKLQRVDLPTLQTLYSLAASKTLNVARNAITVLTTMALHHPPKLLLLHSKGIPFLVQFLDSPGHPALAEDYCRLLFHVTTLPEIAAQLASHYAPFLLSRLAPPPPSTTPAPSSSSSNMMPSEGCRGLIASCFGLMFYFKSSREILMDSPDKLKIFQGIFQYFIHSENLEAITILSVGILQSNQFQQYIAQRLQRPSMTSSLTSEEEGEEKDPMGFVFSRILKHVTSVFSEESSKRHVMAGLYQLATFAQLEHSLMDRYQAKVTLLIQAVTEVLGAAPPLPFALQYFIDSMQLPSIPPAPSPSPSAPFFLSPSPSSVKMEKKEMKCREVTPFMKMTRDATILRNDTSLLETVIYQTSATGKGKYYYEVHYGMEGASILIGWASNLQHFQLQEQVGLGTSIDSWAFDTSSGVKWHNNVPHIYKSKKKQKPREGLDPASPPPPPLPSDPPQLLEEGKGGLTVTTQVVGCALDLDDRKMSFYCNGKPLTTTFPLDPTLHYYPALTLRSAQQCSVIFSPVNFAFPRDGFQPFQSYG